MAFEWRYRIWVFKSFLEAVLSSILVCCSIVKVIILGVVAA
jgi:hypothetical protein